MSVPKEIRLYRYAGSQSHSFRECTECKRLCVHIMMDNTDVMFSVKKQDSGTDLSL